MLTRNNISGVFGAFSPTRIIQPKKKKKKGFGDRSFLNHEDSFWFKKTSTSFRQNTLKKKASIIRGISIKSPTSPFQSHLSSKRRQDSKWYGGIEHLSVSAIKKSQIMDSNMIIEEDSDHAHQHSISSDENSSWQKKLIFIRKKTIAKY